MPMKNARPWGEEGASVGCDTGAGQKRKEGSSKATLMLRAEALSSCGLVRQPIADQCGRSLERTLLTSEEVCGRKRQPTCD